MTTKKNKELDGANIIIPEVSGGEFDGLRIFDHEGNPICDIGIVPEEAQPDGEVGEEQVKIKFKSS